MGASRLDARSGAHGMNQEQRQHLVCWRGSTAVGLDSRWIGQEAAFGASAWSTHVPGMARSRNSRRQDGSGEGSKATPVQGWLGETATLGQQRWRPGLSAVQPWIGTKRGNRRSVGGTAAGDTIADRDACYHAGGRVQIFL